jgi:hypothetical protein
LISRAKPPISAPAQKAFPAPVIIIARTSGSRSASLNASTISRPIVELNAFILSGRFSVTTAASPLVS